MNIFAMTNHPSSRPAVFRYGVAVILTIVAVALRAALQPVLGETLPLQLLTFAVLVSAWWGGLGAGLLATALCAIAAHLFFISSGTAHALTASSDALHLLIFICTGAAISAIAEALHRAVRRVQAQTKALRVSEERLRLAVKATEDAVWDWDIATNSLSWSPAVAERFGWPEAPPGTSTGWWQERIHADDRTRVVQGIRAVVADPACSHWEEEYRFQRGDGSIADVLDRGFVLRDSQGKAVRMIGAMLDLTSRKQAAAAVHRSREELQIIIDTVPSLISYVDRNFVYRWNNRAYERWFDRPLAEITGRPMWDLMGRVAFERVRPNFERVFTGEPHAFEDYLPYEGSKGRWIHAIYAPHVAPDGTVDGAVVSVADISERKHAELAQAALAAIVENSDDAIIGKTLEGVVTSWNRAATRLFGFTAEEMIGQKITRIFPPDRFAEEERILTSVRSGEGVQPYEAQRQTKNGRLIDVAVTTSPVHDSTGKVVGASTIARDITERRRAMEELRLTTERFDAALRASPVVVFEQDRNLRYTWIHNSKMGLTTTGVRGKTDFDIMERAEDAEVNVAMRRRVIDTGLRQRTEMHLQAGGTMRDYDISVEPRFDEAGVVVGVICAALDITQHKAAEAALRESREALSLALAGAKMGTWDWEVDTGELRWSDRTYELFGLPPGKGQTYEDFLARLHPEDRSRVDIDIRNALEHEPHNHECEYRVMLPDGSVRWVFAKGGAHFDSTGRPVRMIGVLLDVTDRVLTSERLGTALDAAESANRAKDSFLAALSHELRTPLTPVLFLAASLERSPDVAPNLREDFAMIRRNIELEARLIDDLLDVTRITRGKLQLDLQPTDLHHIVARSIELLQRDVDAHHLVLKVDLAAERYQANADPVRLQQVFWNVLKNAVKFTPEHGSITVRSHCEESGRWQLSVTDSGLGITAEELPTIFNAFAQGDEASSHRFGGLGLGLTISERVVREHGGRISAESPGRNLGSTFYIDLPVLPDAPPAGVPADSTVPAAAPAHRLRRLLVVDDHEPTRLTLGRLLKKRGYDVTIAANAENARELAAASSFDLMVSDLGLPDGSGHELAEEFGRDYGLKSIALSGYGRDEDLARSKAAGFLDHITKPVDIEALHNAILRALDGAN